MKIHEKKETLYTKINEKFINLIWLFCFNYCVTSAHEIYVDKQQK